VLTLYDYYRSSCAYRVRIALNIKALEYDCKPIHLINNGGEQFSQDYIKKNPQALVPTLVHDDFVISQSLAIIDYLETLSPQPALIPKDVTLRAVVKQVALIIACDIHPLDNLRVLRYLSDQFNMDDAEKNIWYQHWILQGFAAVETILQQHDGPYCFGDSPSLADVCLVPQVYNARRFNCELKSFARICAIEAHCLQQPAFYQAAPEAQASV
jgi:maleylacetoacetate isomerase